MAADYYVNNVTSTVQMMDLEMLLSPELARRITAMVLEEIEKQHKQIGFNYLLAYLFLGTMSAETAMRSLKLFTAEVMPALERM